MCREKNIPSLQRYDRTSPPNSFSCGRSRRHQDLYPKNTKRPKSSFGPFWSSSSGLKPLSESSRKSDLMVSSLPLATDSLKPLPCVENCVLDDGFGGQLWPQSTSSVSVRLLQLVVVVVLSCPAPQWVASLP